jgi:cobalt/nickel transport system permease protein
VADRDAFLARNMLSLASVLSRLRLDDGREGRLSPTAPVKLLCALVCILLTSLARNHLFVLLVLAATLVRASLLPRTALVRVVGTTAAAAGLSLLLALPAILLGQPRSALSLAGKALACTGITMIVTATTRPAQLSGALRHARLPDFLIVTVDIALRSIVRLGDTAGEALAALTLRSVGRNRRKQASLSGVGGVVLVKAGVAARETYDAMTCRCYDGSYQADTSMRLGWRDALWLCLVALATVLFVYLQGMV